MLVCQVQMEFWDIDALLVRPYIQQPQDLRNKTIAAPAGSTSHYQLLYFLDLLKLTDAVTVWTEAALRAC